MEHTVTADQLKELVEGAPTVSVDVRDEFDWETRRIIGAINLPFPDLARRWRTLDETRQIVLVCEHGERSASALQFLSAQCGLTNVFSLEGGMSGWTGPTESSYE